MGQGGFRGRTVGIVLRLQGQAVGVVVGDTGWGGVCRARVCDEVSVTRWTGKRECGVRGAVLGRDEGCFHT